MKQKKCIRCKKNFYPNIWNQVFCGSKKNKLGCSWASATEDRNKRRWQDDSYRSYQKEYGKIWKKMQRRLNSDYAQKQLKLKREYGRSIHGKEISKNWRKKNIDKILFWNKRRKLLKKNIVGVHTWKEWQDLKKKYEYRCAICKVSEKELVIKWSYKSFSKLTEDHIIPITKGGSNFISNIQPLCISCNAKKKDT